MTSRTYHRRNYFIKKGFQLRYTLAIVATLLVVMLVSGIGLYLGMWGSIIENFSKFKVSEDLENIRRITDYEEARFKKGDYRLEKIFREAELLSERDRLALKDALASVNRSLIPKVLMLAILIFIGGIFLSHKIAGPMYRIEKSADSIREGDLKVNFRIRKDDEMRETASTLDEMLESLRHDIGAVKAAAVKLKENINSMSSAIPPEEKRRLRELIDDIEGLLSKYKT